MFLSKGVDLFHTSIYTHIMFITGVQETVLPRDLTKICANISIIHQSKQIASVETSDISHTSEMSLYSVP